MNQNAFAIQKTGWIGCPVNWSGTVWSTSPVYAADGVTITTPGVPADITGWYFRLRVKARYGDPDSAAIFAPPDWQTPTGTGPSGVWSAPEMPSTVTVLLKGGSTLVFDIKVIQLGASEPIEFLAGSIAINETAGTDLFTVPVTP